MAIQESKQAEFLELLDRHTSDDGIGTTPIPNLHTIRTSQLNARQPQVYPPGIVLGAQGIKHIYLGGKRYVYGRGHMIASFLSVAALCEVVQASPEKPLLGIGITMDLNRISQMIVTMARFEPFSSQIDEGEPSAIFTAPIKENLLDAAVRLLRTLENPSEAAILGQSVVDEIFFRLLSEEQNGRLKNVLQQRGQIQQIARAVEHLQNHLDKPVSIDELASLVNMSSSGFHKKFKQVMHASPLQYAKSIKLNRAQEYLMSGKTVSETAYLVGYNNLAQFSREYKRHFGNPPSTTSQVMPSSDLRQYAL
ncbi:MAG: AraC family transcriptional regulator [Chloroflexota bacterium]